MECGKPTVISDLYSGMPGHGENRLDLEVHGGTLTLSVYYDSVEGGEGDGEEEQSRKFIFSGVVGYCASDFPGVDTTRFTYSEGPAPMGSLVEFENSEAARQWTSVLKGSRIRHFLLCFTLNNQQSITVLLARLRLWIKPSFGYNFRGVLL